jgi:hypothetical protein
MACYFRFEGIVERRLSEVQMYFVSYESVSVRPPSWYILEQLMPLEENRERKGFPSRLATNAVVDTSAYELADIINLLEQLNFDGVVLYRSDDMGPFARYRFRRSAKTSGFSVKYLES